MLERSKAAITSRGSLHISTEFDGLKLLFTSDETGDISSFDMTDLQLNVIQSSRGGFNADGKVSRRKWPLCCCAWCSCETENNERLLDS